ncbi:MAG: aa3-type cytochrome c oxidase subunit IV [Devosia sp.]
MADHSSETRHPDMDYEQHEATWANVLRLTKWAVIILAVLLVVLYFVINP